MDIVPPPSEDQMPRLQAFRWAPGHRDRQPRRLACGHVAGLPGRQDPRGQFGLCQLLDRLDELFASG